MSSVNRTQWAASELWTARAGARSDDARLTPHLTVGMVRALHGAMAQDRAGAHAFHIG